MGEFNLLFTVFMFLVTISVLVVIHEFGHFWVARRCGVKVLTFSVGFGKPLFRWRRKHDETEYVVAPWLLGGYVKMLDAREAPVPESELHREFNHQVLWKRTAIVLAGPLANLILAVIAYWLMFMVGTPGLKPEVAAVEPQSIAASSGLRAGDLIVEVDGNKTQTWQSVQQALLGHIVSAKNVTLIVRNEQTGERRVQLALAQMDPVLDGEPNQNLFKQVGIEPGPVIESVVGRVVPGKPAEKAGLQEGDTITRVGDTPVSTWQEWVEIIKKHPDEPLAMEILRNGQTMTVSATPEAIERNGETQGFLGVGPHDKYWAMERYGFFAAFGQATQRTWEMTLLSLKFIGKMIVGEASVKNLSGPITIAKFAGDTAKTGLTTFLRFLALISISLFIVNLLPIPVLDGGHLVLFAIEWIKGKPVSDAAQIQFRVVGFVMVMLLMSLAIYNDVMRWF